MNDPVNKPSHYIKNGFEVIDIIETILKDIPQPYNTATIGAYMFQPLKYMMRAGHKGGKFLEDLKKARFYIDRLINLIETEMTLVDHQIKELIEHPKDGQEPLVDLRYYDPDLINSSSLDIRIGNHIEIRRGFPALVKLLAFLGISPTWANKLCWWERINICRRTEDNPYWVAPGTRLLAESLEIFNFPDTVNAQFILKSTNGRLFWEHQLAGYCDPGWNGSRLTMELINQDLGYLKLYPGMRIGQLVFNENEIPDRSYAVTGRYNNDLTVTQAK